MSGKFDVLVSTNIVESGLDIPTANTMIIHRADMFGLAQLYQLRGRIGRSKQRAYAYLTTPPRQEADRDRARGGWKCCSRWISWAPASPSPATTWISAAPAICLGEEQSGHVREVGIELYQEMLEEAVRAAARHGGDGRGRRQVVAADQSRRAGADPGRLCRRPQCPLVALSPVSALDRDARRHRPLRRRADRPLRRRCRTRSSTCSRSSPSSSCASTAGVEKIDAGPKGGTIAFRDNRSPIREADPLHQPA